MYYIGYREIVITLKDGLITTYINFTVTVTNTPPTFVFTLLNTTTLTNQIVSINNNIAYTLPSTTDQENNIVSFKAYYDTYGNPLPTSI